MEQNLQQEWHALDRDVVCGHLDVDCDSGLSADEARLRLERFGPNELKEEAGEALFSDQWQPHSGAT